MDTKKIAIVLFSVLFVATAVLLGYYLILTKRPDRLKVEEAGEKAGTVNIIPKVNYPNDPVTKNVYGNNEGVLYKLEGTFIEKPGKKGPLLSGVFVLKGDTGGREMNVLAGALDGNIFIGTFDGTFDGSSTWTAVPVDQVLAVISPGQPVLLKYTYRFTGGKEDSEKIKELEAIFDKLSEEIKAGKADFKIRPTFIITAEAMGVIR